jgi:hypothetical protein
MPRINLHRNLQETKRPNRSGRASALNGQLPLDRAAYATKQSVVGAFVRAALAHQREDKQQSEEWNHARLTRGDVNCRIGERPDVFPWTESTKDSVPE